MKSGRIPGVRANHVLLKNHAVVGDHWGAYNARDPSVVQEAHDELMRLHAEGKVIVRPPR